MSNNKKNTQSISIKRYKNGGVYLKPSDKDMLSRYDFGGLLQGVLGGAASGSPLGPVGMIGGALLGGLSSTNNQQQPQHQQQPIYQRPLPQQQYYTPTFPEGGEVNSNKYNINDDIPTSQFYTKRLPGILPSLKDRAELNYYETILNNKLKEKYPDIYSKVPIWNQDKPLSPKTRVSKADSLAKENPNFYISADDQKKLLGDSWNRYVKLRGQYGKDLNLVGEGDDVSKPETWKFGARHAAAFNPAGYTYLYQPESSSNPTNKFEYEMKYDPSQSNPYIVTKENRYKYNDKTNDYVKYESGGLMQGSGYRTNYSYKYPMGGMTQPNAELEKGEPFMTPNGQIDKISDNAPTHQQGGVPMNLPEGTQILGKMVDPEFNKQYKELGARLKKAQDKYNKVLENKPTPLAKKTAKMMLDRVQNEFNELMSRQESMKGNNQPNPQLFPYGGMPLMENGRVSTQYGNGGYSIPKYAEPDESNGYSMTIPLRGTSQYDYRWENPNGQIDYSAQQPQQYQTIDYESIPQPYQSSNNQDVTQTDFLNSSNYRANLDSFTRIANDRLNDSFKSGLSNLQSRSNSGNDGYNDIENNGKKSTLDKIAGLSSTLGSLAPIGYNLAKGIFGKAQKLNASDYMNPYTGQIKSLMSDRRYNVDPELESNRLATSQYYQNLKQAAPSQSRYLAGLQTGQVSKQRADAEAYARKQNIDNQYKAEQAGTLGSLGQQEASTKFAIQDINSRAQAAQNAYLPTALSQLQQVSLIGKQMAGQKNLDKQRLAIAEQMYKNYPFLKDYFQQFENK